jgi:hypothetical protein
VYGARTRGGVCVEGGGGDRQLSETVRRPLRRVAAGRPSPDPADSPPTSIFVRAEAPCAGQSRTVRLCSVELVEEGYALRERHGRRNRYRVVPSFPCVIPLSRDERWAICLKCCSRRRRQPRVAGGDAQRRRTGPTARDWRDLHRPHGAQVRDGRERASLGRTVSDPGAARAQPRSSVLLSATARLGHERAATRPGG